MMEHIGKILRKKINTPGENTDTSSSGEDNKKPSPSAGCPLCNSTGFVHPRQPSGKPDYSRIIPCHCVLKQIDREHQQRLQGYSNLGALARFTFDNLLPQGRSGNPANQERFRQAYHAAKAFAAEPHGWLVFSGPSGSGKTHLAVAIVNERINNGQPAFYQSVPDLLDHLRSAFSPDSEVTYDELFERICTAPLLVLDDMGIQAGTPWAKEKLDQLLNHRFNNELPTVIVATGPVEQFDDRVRTRLTASRLSQKFILEENPPVLSQYSWGPQFELQKRMTFKSFDPRRSNLTPEQRVNLEMVYQEAMNFAQSPDGWLVLQGVNGCGKTHLAAAIVNHRYEAGKPALFIVVPEFLDHLRSTFSPESRVTYDQLFESVKSAPFLILDDFGEQSSTPWAKEKLYQVINYRYNARLVTVITTSCSLDEIDNRISSRLADSKISNVFYIVAPDYRSDLHSNRPTRKTPGKRPR